MVNSLSIVVPALNERSNLSALMATMPLATLAQQGWSVEVVVVDNGSTDGTAELARELGARVVQQPLRGYGHAYRAGLNSVSSEVIATGDADLTYPFDALPQLLAALLDRGLDFLSTNRLSAVNKPAMKPSHTFGNHVLSGASKALLRTPFRDSQSGMWVFRREVWRKVRVRSNGMGFSQEIKNEAYLRGFRCGEVPIEYRQRGGEVKLNATRDGIGNLAQLAAHRLRVRRGPRELSHVHVHLPPLRAVAPALPAQPVQDLAEDNVAI